MIQLYQNVRALMILSYTDLPNLRVAYPTQDDQVFYGFGDASGGELYKMWPSPIVGTEN